MVMYTYKKLVYNYDVMYTKCVCQEKGEESHGLHEKLFPGR